MDHRMFAACLVVAARGVWAGPMAGCPFPYPVAQFSVGGAP
jgi:hypothetical protein